MKGLVGFVLACALATAAPFLRAPSTEVVTGFPGWPASLDGRALQELPLDARDQRFADGFPGRIATFTDGRRRVLLRWIVRPSRQLHAAADCLRGAGYAIEPRPLVVDAEQRIWAATAARFEGDRFLIRERIVGARGDAFTDSSSWYWSALLGRSEGPWLAWTVFEKE